MKFLMQSALVPNVLPVSQAFVGSLRAQRGSKHSSRCLRITEAGWLDWKVDPYISAVYISGFAKVD